MCIIFMEDEAWDVYVFTFVYIKSKMYVIIRIVMNEINSAKKEKKLLSVYR